MIHEATLPSLLRQLRLGAMHTQWQELAEQAQQAHWTYAQFLATLCDRELAVREQKRIQSNIAEAKLPIGKTIDTFNFDKLTSINPAQISAFAEDTTWTKRAQNLMLFGASGVGKTHLAAAIGRRLTELGVKVFFTKTTTLVQKLQVAHREQKLADCIAKLAKFQLLILDDIGYVKKTEAETSVLFELIADRYETGSVLITSNHTFDQWEDIFPSNVMTVAAIDRLVHHATIVNIHEGSYRKKSAQQTNG